MTVRVCVAAVLLAALLAGIAIALVARNHTQAGVITGLVGLLAALAALLWLLDEEPSR